MIPTQEMLGKIITSEAGRDAVHIAVAPMYASENLNPGDHVGITGKDTVGGSAERKIGIVDPLLRRPVMQGDRFFVWLYPNTITGLRHVWTHPQFENEAKSSKPGHTEDEPSKTQRKVAIDWVTDLAEGLGLDYGDLMEAADGWADRGEYYNMGSNQTYEDYYDEFPQFWAYYELITGKKVTAEKTSFFSCSC